jgi:hypothetical protein
MTGGIRRRNLLCYDLTSYHRSSSDKKEPPGEMPVDPRYQLALSTDGARKVSGSGTDSIRHFGGNRNLADRRCISSNWEVSLVASALHWVWAGNE